MSAALPLAHSGHWLESAAFALPPLLLICLLLGAAVYARRHPQATEDREAGR